MPFSRLVCEDEISSIAEGSPGYCVALPTCPEARLGNAKRRSGARGNWAITPSADEDCRIAVCTVPYVKIYGKSLLRCLIEYIGLHTYGIYVDPEYFGVHASGTYVDIVYFYLIPSTQLLHDYLHGEYTFHVLLYRFRYLEDKHQSR